MNTSNQQFLSRSLLLSRQLAACIVLVLIWAASAGALAVDCSNLANSGTNATNAINGAGGFASGGHPKDHIIGSGYVREQNGTTAFANNANAVAFLSAWGQNGANHANVGTVNVTRAIRIDGSDVDLNPQLRADDEWEDLAAVYVRVVWKRVGSDCRLVTMFPSATTGGHTVGTWN